MLLTEDVARKMWCPMVRYARPNDSAGLNRWKQSEPTPHALNPIPCRCIASDCMMWQWVPHPEWILETSGGGVGRIDPRNILDPIADKNASFTYENKIKNTAPPRGYCGLAGKPETAS